MEGFIGLLAVLVTIGLGAPALAAAPIAILKAERLSAIASAMPPLSAQRELLEEQRDMLAVDWVLAARATRLEPRRAGIKWAFGGGVFFILVWAVLVVAIPNAWWVYFFYGLGIGLEAFGSNMEARRVARVRSAVSRDRFARGLPVA